MSLTYLYSKTNGYVLPGKNPCNTQPNVVPSANLCGQNPSFVVTPYADSCACYDGDGPGPEPQPPVVVAPSAPTGLTLAYAQGETVQLYWTAPTTGGPPSSYLVQWQYTIDPEEVYSATAQSTFITIESINPGIETNFLVYSVNSAGQSSPVQLLRITTPTASKIYTSSSYNVLNKADGIFTAVNATVPTDFDAYANRNFVNPNTIALSYSFTSSIPLRLPSNLWFRLYFQGNTEYQNTYTRGITTDDTGALSGGSWTTNNSWVGMIIPSASMILQFSPDNPQTTAGLYPSFGGSCSFSFSYLYCTGAFSPYFLQDRPMAPDNFVPVYYGTDTIQLKWDDVVQADSYLVEYFVKAGGASQYFSTANNWATITGLTPGAEYFFVVYSFNGAYSEASGGQDIMMYQATGSGSVRVDDLTTLPVAQTNYLGSLETPSDWDYHNNDFRDPNPATPAGIGWILNGYFNSTGSTAPLSQIYVITDVDSTTRLSFNCTNLGGTPNIINPWTVSTNMQPYMVNQAKFGVYMTTGSNPGVTISGYMKVYIRYNPCNGTYDPTLA